MKQRTYGKFTDAELKIIKTNSGKVTVEQLAVLLGKNYQNTSGALRYHKVAFTPYRAPRTGNQYRKEDSALNNQEKDKKGNPKYLTDKIMREYSYM